MKLKSKVSYADTRRISLRITIPREIIGALSLSGGDTLCWEITSPHEIRIYKQIGGEC